MKNSKYIKTKGENKMSKTRLVLMVLFLIVSVPSYSMAGEALDLFGIVVDSVTEGAGGAIEDFNRDYGQGATESLSRGSGSATDIEYYRQTINGLYEENKISRNDRDDRLSRLFSYHDSYKAGRISKQKYDNLASSLTRR
jgi:hypothetical protein